MYSRLLTRFVLPMGLLAVLFGLGADRITGANGLLDTLSGNISSSQLQAIVRQLEAEAASGQEVPKNLNLTTFLRGNLGGKKAKGDPDDPSAEMGGSKRDPSVDQFGSPYVLLQYEGGDFAVISCGPDADCHTTDDLVAYGSFKRRGFSPAGDEIPGWSRDTAAGPPRASTTPSAGASWAWLRTAVGWLKANPWLGFGLVGLWLVGLIVGRLSSRSTQPSSAPSQPLARVSMALPEPRPAARASMESLALEDLPLAPAPEPEPTPAPPAPPPPPPPAPRQPVMTPMDPIEAPRVAPPGPAPLPAPAPAPVPARRPERPRFNSGEYSFVRGRSTSPDPETPPPPPPAPPAPAPRAPPRSVGDGGVVERVRPGGIVTETQRINAHLEQKRGRGPEE